MSAATHWINPDVLRWARERLNLTREQVTDESKKLARHFYSRISAVQLAGWERGESDPELKDLETLAEIYVCPVGYFFLEAKPQERSPMTFRGLAKDRDSLSSVTHRTLERFLELARWTADLLRKTEQSWPVRIRPGEADSGRAAETLALEYRQRFAWTPEHVGSLPENQRKHSGGGAERLKVRECSASRCGSIRKTYAARLCGAKIIRLS